MQINLIIQMFHKLSAVSGTFNFFILIDLFLRKTPRLRWLWVLCGLQKRILCYSGRVMKNLLIYLMCESFVTYAPSFFSALFCILMFLASWVFKLEELFKLEWSYCPSSFFDDLFDSLYNFSIYRSFNLWSFFARVFSFLYRVFSKAISNEIFLNYRIYRAASKKMSLIL